jgi:hypothetical protein
MTPPCAAVTLKSGLPNLRLNLGSFKYSFLRSTENCSRCTGKQEATWETRRKWQDNIEMDFECIEFDCKMD